MEPKAIARRSSQYFFVKIYVTITHVAAQFIIAKLFTVAGYGAYGFLFLILTYGASLHFGLENAFGKQYPVERGKNNKQRADSLRDSALTFSMIITFVVMVILILFAVLYPEIPYERRWALIILAFTLPIQIIVEFYRTFFRVTREFGRINWMEIINGTADFVLRVAPVYYFVSISPSIENAFIGLFVGLFLSFVLTFLYAYFTAPEKIRIRWNIPEVKYLYRLGIPIFICLVMDSLFKNGDKFMATAFYGDEGMGYYYLGSQVAGLLYFVPFAVGWVVFPLMLQKYGETCDGTKVTNFVFPPTSTIVQTLIPLAAMMYLSLDYLVPLLLPKYIPTIQTTKILIIGMYFWCIATMFMYFLIAMDDRKRMVIFQVFCLLLNLALNWFFWAVLGLYIVGIALGTTISYVLYSYILIRFTMMKYFGVEKAFILYYLKLFLAQALIFTAIVLLDVHYLSSFWTDYFNSLEVFTFFKDIPALSFGYGNLLLHGFGIFSLLMASALIIGGAISLAIRYWNLLDFKVTMGQDG